jgi:hypothetical protein
MFRTMMKGSVYSARQNEQTWMPKLWHRWWCFKHRTKIFSNFKNTFLFLHLLLLQALHSMLNLGLFQDFSPLVLIPWLLSTISNAHCLLMFFNNSSHLITCLPTHQVTSGLCTVNFLQGCCSYILER